jgi:type VI secretion system protein ImpF
VSRLNPEQQITPSMLNRLVEADASIYGIEQMFAAVRRDLEDLLNTRQSHYDLPEQYEELRRSVLAYGVPDLVSLNALSSGQRQEIGQLVALMVERYEPRLRDIDVTLIEGKESGEYTLRFHVNAKLAMDPAPAVAFDTILELATGRYSTATGTRR